MDSCHHSMACTSGIVYPWIPVTTAWHAHVNKSIRGFLSPQHGMHMESSPSVDSCQNSMAWTWEQVHPWIPVTTAWHAYGE